MTQIHETAIVDSSAEIGEGTTIGPYSVVGPKVKIGKSCEVMSHVVLDGNTTIGDEAKIYPFASIGTAPQDLKFKGEDSVLEIGNKNIIREYVTLQPGTEGGGMITKIGDGNLFMVNTHVGHDSILGDGNIIANCATLAGHVTLGSFITVGGLAAIHQFVKIGDHAFLSGGSMAVQDIPPYCMVQGDRAELVGINTIGLQRRGFSDDDIKLIKRAYRKLFVSKEGGRISERVSVVRDEVSSSEAALRIVDFVASSERGVANVRSKDSK